MFLRNVSLLSTTIRRYTRCVRYIAFKSTNMETARISEVISDKSEINGVCTEFFVRIK
jgi:hypothetical protein